MDPQDQNQTQPPTSLNASQVPEPGIAPQTPPETLPAAPPPSRSGKKLLLVLMILVVAAAAGVAAMHFSHSKRLSTATVKRDIPLLRVSLTGSPLNIFYPAGKNLEEQTAVNGQVFEGLVQYVNKSKIVPALATGWSNPDDSTWVFTLRRGVKFHTGRTMTAKDVVYSLNAGKSNPDLGEFTNGIKDVQALNDYQVKITTDGPDPTLLNQLIFLFIIDSQSPKQDDPVNGTGPFQAKPNSKQTADMVDLVAFDQYYGGHVYTRELRFVSIGSEEAAAKALKAGQLNIAGSFATADHAGLRGTRYTQIKTAYSNVSMLTVNHLSPGPLQKLAARQAIQYALDVPQIIKASGLSANPASQMITIEIPGYSPNVKAIKHDEAKAKQLLKDAGYPTGFPLKLTYTETQESQAKAIQQQLGALGINVTLEYEGDFDKYIGIAVGGKTDLAIIGYTSDLLDSYDVFSTVLQQSENYKSDTFDADLAAAAKTIDPADRLSALQKTSEYVSKDVAVVPLYQHARIWYSDKPYHIVQDSENGAAGVNYWKVYQ